MICGTKEIITDPVKLGSRATEVSVIADNKELRDTVAALKRTLSKRDDLKALSAPAIGVDMRVFCIKYNKNEITTYVNPVIVNQSGLSLSRESCSSIPDKEFIRIRNNDITVAYQTPRGIIENKRLVGMAAYVFQHEVDHLDGILLDDIGFEVWEDFDNATEEERQEVISEYITSLDIKRDEINTEIEQDPELKQIKDAVRFMTGVYTGEIKQTIDEV